LLLGFRGFANDRNVPLRIVRVAIQRYH
jgi:hypothetical protein